jgi:hypothetical protein
MLKTRPFQRNIWFCVGEERKEIFTDLMKAETPNFHSKAKGLLDAAAYKGNQVVDVSVHTGLEGELQLLQLSQLQFSQAMFGTVLGTVPTISSVDVQRAFSILNPVLKGILAEAKYSKMLTLACKGL